MLIGIVILSGTVIVLVSPLMIRLAARKPIGTDLVNLTNIAVFNRLKRFGIS